MAQLLRVTIPFASYQKGDEITDPTAIEQALADNRGHVVPVNVPDEKRAEKPADPEPAEK